MSQYILGMGRIEFAGKTQIDIIEKIEEILNAHGESFHNIKLYGREIEFEMVGNHGIDYAELKKIAKLLKRKKVKYRITVGEFAECEEGFYEDRLGDK